MRTMTMSLRALFLIGFVVAMPVLALPAVARRVDGWLYGSAPSGFPSATARPIAKQLQVVEPLAVERASPASYSELELPETPARSHGEGLDLAPAFPPLEAHPPLALPAAERSDNPLSPAALDRLRGIRQELEDLGAQYVLLETTDGSGQYRFHCQMSLNEASPYTREFEASAPDPLVAAERVLEDAKTWRRAATAKETLRQ